MNLKRLQGILQGLVQLSHETEWVEFKHNNCDPAEIGEYISAISNAAVIHDKDFGYIAWGIEDGNHDVIGTNFQPRKMRVQQQDLEHWLAIGLRPKVDFRIFEFTFKDKPVVLFEIPQAAVHPVSFKECEYIRVGSHKKRLKDHPDKEKSLWSGLSRRTFEDNIALSSQSSAQVFEFLAYRNYFAFIKQPPPNEPVAVLERLATENFIKPIGGDLFDITNLGAILFATDMNRFPGLSRKVLRVIHYKGTDRIGITNQEKVGKLGYATGFVGAMNFIQTLLPTGQVMGEFLRREVKAYPTIAVRELVANALIHQDFSMTGTGPMVEIFDDRIEITNPGGSLTPVDRFIDAPPRSRNEALAAFMRRVGICEEQGLGIDRVIDAAEMFQLPPPEFIVIDNSHTKAILYSPRGLVEMDLDERVRACYQHACLLYVGGGRKMTNESLRKRFGIADGNYPQASKIIKEAMDRKLVKPFGDTSSRRFAKYVPYWV